MENPYDKSAFPLGHAVWRALADAAAGDSEASLTLAELLERLQALPGGAFAKTTKKKVCGWPR